MEREKQGNTETLNVVVEAAYPSEVSHTQGHVTMGKHAIHSNVVHSPSQDTDRVNTQVLSSQADALSFALKQSSRGAADVLASGEKIKKEIKDFANRYGREQSPLDNPKSQAYLQGSDLAVHLN